MKQTSKRNQGALTAATLMLCLAAGSARALSPDASPGFPDTPLDALSVRSVWPANEADAFPLDGVVEILFEGEIFARSLPKGMAVVVTDLTRPEAPVAVPGRLVANMAKAGWGVFWTPDAPLAADGRYHLVVSDTEPTDPAQLGVSLAEATFKVGRENAAPVASAAAPTWCLDTVQPELNCVNWDSGFGCSEWTYGPPELRARASVVPPDGAALARTGRWFEVREPTSPAGSFSARGVLEPELRHHVVPGVGNTCVGLRVKHFGGGLSEVAESCAPEGLALCADARPLESSEWQPYDAPGDGAGANDAGGDAESEGCQASPGAGGVPLVAGLFALLLGLGRRRRG